MVAVSYLKLCAVIATLYAGWNIYRLMTAFKDVLAELNDYKLALGNTDNASKVSPWGVLVYLGLYGAYLTLLYHAKLNSIVLFLIAVKFLVTACLGFWIAQSIFQSNGYTRLHHNISRIDNVTNVIFSFFLIYALIFPLPF